MNTIKCYEKGKGMLRAESFSFSHNEIQPLGVVAQRLTDPYSRFSCIPGIIPSNLRRPTINWQSHLSPGLDLLIENVRVGIKTLLLKIIKATNKRQSAELV
jgi:hypothetical protein